MMKFSFFFEDFFFSKILCNQLVFNNFTESSCLCWCKGTNFLANHNLGMDTHMAL